MTGLTMYFYTLIQMINITLRKHLRNMLNFPQAVHGNCQIKDSRGNTFHVKSRDFGNYNELVSLLLRTLINATCWLMKTDNLMDLNIDAVEIL